MRETPWLLLPVKSLQCGKRRLEPALTNADRLRLNEFFLRRMITVGADFPGLERTVIVSDAADSLRLAAELGARTIRTERQELNAALADGCGELYRQGARQIMILPVDLPLVQSSDLREIAALGERHPIVICPDRSAVGTNALFLGKELPLQFRFGDDSYRQHEAEARRCCVPPMLHHNARIARDVDLPADLAVLHELADLNA
jgi:2-phospho-L-lactate/phosphoenolpyruvate guanylyltransferase